MNAQDNAGHLTVAAAVFSALAAQDLECAKAFAQSYPDQPNESVPVQIQRLNRYWREQLGQASVSTINARECLIDNCEVQDWIRLFAAEVVPVVCELRLPRIPHAFSA